MPNPLPNHPPTHLPPHLPKFDLHSHSTYSDGLLTPDALVRRAALRGVNVLALTDHDETAGLAEARATAQEMGVTLIPGAELSVSWEAHTLHVLGLGIDAANSELDAGLASIRSGRDARARRMAAGLAEAGIPGAYEGARNYVTSDAGDQGNGWWISAKAASALEAHEQRHVASSKDLYDQHVQPVLDRIANSRALGADKTYKSSDAKALLSRQIGWKSGLEAFVENDQANNAPNMIVDTNDTASGALPRPQHGPRKIGGKDFDNYLVMLSEPDPT